MKFVVTGATGFVGRHVISRLLASGHTVVAVARDIDRARTLPWFDDVEFVAHDLQNEDWIWDESTLPDVLIHLAWPGLPNFRNFFHISENYPADLRFLESAVRAGVSHLIISGTCLEYGLQSGPLLEEMETHPVTPYGFSKDALRRSLEFLQIERGFTLQWMRLFYMYGDGQNPNSLVLQLDRALDEGRKTFNMSGGDQLRDYLPVEVVARCFDWIAARPEIHGVINCCSGKPVSVLDMVSRHLARRGRTIDLNRGYYPYPEYEPMAFWGIPAKLLHGGFEFSETDVLM